MIGEAFCWLAGTHKTAWAIVPVDGIRMDGDWLKRVGIAAAGEHYFLSASDINYGGTQARVWPTRVVCRPRGVRFGRRQSNQLRLGNDQCLVGGPGWGPETGPCVSAIPLLLPPCRQNDVRDSAITAGERREAAADDNWREGARKEKKSAKSWPPRRIVQTEAGLPSRRGSPLL